MIGTIYSGSASILVSGGTTGTYINGSNGAQGVGNMRYNTSTQKTEVFDGTNWIQLNMGSVSVGLSNDAESLLQWARKKRNEEIEREQLAESNPAIKDLLEQIKTKEDQIKMITILLKNSSIEAEQQIKPSMIP